MTVQPVIVSIPPSERLRSAQHVALQREYARLALQRCATLCGAPASGWEKDERDVPRVNAGFYWSISHKPHRAAAVISQEPVGIDIEHVRPRERRLHDELADATEWSLLEDRSWHAFFRLWTAKEAVLKAHGLGIGAFHHCRLIGTPDDRHMVLTLRDATWQVEHYERDAHITAVTSRGGSVHWNVTDETASLSRAECQAVAFPGTNI